MCYNKEDSIITPIIEVSNIKISMINTELFINPFVEMWSQVALWLPKLIVALIVLAVGMMIARIVYKAVVKIFGSGLDSVVRPLVGAVERAGYQVRVGHIIGWIVKWFIIIFTVLVALDIVELQSARSLLTLIASYVPNVLAAIVVLFVGFILGDFVKKLVKGSTRMLNFKSAAMLGSLARTAVLVFTVLVVLDLLGLGRIFQILLIGLVAMLALAGGLAFGLGGRDAARDAIEKAKQSMR